MQLPNNFTVYYDTVMKQLYNKIFKIVYFHIYSCSAFNSLIYNTKSMFPLNGFQKQEILLLSR